MEMENVKITPALAREWLEQVPEFQRKITRRQVEKIKTAILRGEWRENGATIVFNRDKQLIDGQHRLHAIMESGKPCHSLVVRNVSSGEQTFITIDDAESREFKDFLRVKNTCGVASMAKWYWHFVNDDFPVRSKMPPIADLQKLCGPYVDDLVSIYTETRGAGRVCRTGAFLGALLFYYRHIRKIANQNLLTDFFKRLGNGEDLSEGNPILALRNRFSLGVGEAMPPHNGRALIMKALHAYLDGRTLRKLSWDPSKEQFPELR